jgi:hypothetical protein
MNPSSRSSPREGRMHLAEDGLGRSLDSTRDSRRVRRSRVSTGGVTRVGSRRGQKVSTGG